MLGDRKGNDLKEFEDLFRGADLCRSRSFGGAIEYFVGAGILEEP